MQLRMPPLLNVAAMRGPEVSVIALLNVCRPFVRTRSATLEDSVMQNTGVRSSGKPGLECLCNEGDYGRIDSVCSIPVAPIGKE